MVKAANVLGRLLASFAHARDESRQAGRLLTVFFFCLSALSFFVSLFPLPNPIHQPIQSCLSPHTFMIRDETFQAQTVAALQDPLQESLKRDLVTLKVRTENRERKKRWREQNEDRSKSLSLLLLRLPSLSTSPSPPPPFSCNVCWYHSTRPTMMPGFHDAVPLPWLLPTPSLARSLSIRPGLMFV